MLGEMKSTLTEEQVKAIIKGAEKELQSLVVEETKKQLATSLTYIINAELREIIQQFFRDEITPSIKSALLMDKPAILKAVVGVAEEIAEELRKALIGGAVQNLSNDYNRRKLLKELFE
jgi:hypothetical protein